MTYDAFSALRSSYNWKQFLFDPIRYVIEQGKEQMFSSLITPAGNPFEGVAESANGLIGTLSELTPALGDAGSTFITSLMGGASAGTALAAAFNPLALLLILVEQVLKGFTDTIGVLITVALQPLFDALYWLGSMIAMIIAPVFQILGAILDATIIPLISMLGIILEPLIDIITVVANIIMVALKPALSVFAILLDIIRPALELVAGFLKIVATGLALFYNAIASIWNVVNNLPFIGDDDVALIDIGSIWGRQTRYYRSG